MQFNIALIGGSGFIGTRLVKRLIESGHKIKILDKAQSQTYPDLWFETDVRDKSVLFSSFQRCDVIYNLAAEHRDDVTPRSLYDEVNVKGAENVCSVADELCIRKIIFTSSVAVYGFTSQETDESGELKPFNDYGRTKLEAEKVYQNWQGKGEGRSLTIVRPTVVFGEGNRGNVYSLLNQMANERFIMVGSGRNVKSMAYVENVAAFLSFSLNFGGGCRLFNSIDKPDFDMNTLVSVVRKQLGKTGDIGLRVPYVMGYVGGLFFDVISKLVKKRFPISAIRIKKFCSNTQFTSSKIKETGFVSPFTLEEGLNRTIQYEFINPRNENEVVFYTE